MMLCMMPIHYWISSSQNMPFRYLTVCIIINTHTHPFNGPFSRTTRVSRYQKGKTNLDFAEARDSEWQWHQQVCTSLQTDNHTSTSPLSFLQAGCPSCRPTNSVKALKACNILSYLHILQIFAYLKVQRHCSVACNVASALNACFCFTSA